MIIDQILDQLQGMPVVRARAASRRRSLTPEAQILLKSAWYQPRSGALQRPGRGRRVGR